jgi:phenylacetate-CoA ligase
LGYPLAKAVRTLDESERWSRERLAEHQRSALSALIHHCYRHVPYYRDAMKARGLSPEDFSETGDLGKLPYLTRDIIREQGERLRADNYPDRLCQFRRSGGTTGEPIRVAADARARAFEVAAYLRGFGWMGYELGCPMVRLFGGSLGLRTNPSLKVRLGEWLLNNRFLPAFELTYENVDDYVEAISRADGGVLVGYASAVLALAEYMSRRGLRGSALRSVICTAEYMPLEWRAKISDVLGAPVYCYYGCGEVNSLAYECSEEEGYLVSQEHVILEVCGPTPEEFSDEGAGPACVTTLFNYAMPLLRYVNGDVIELRRPEAGRAHQRITNVDGRVVDYLLRGDGQKVSGSFVPHLVLRTGCPAWKYQVVQTGLDRIVFNYDLHGGTLAEDMRAKLVDIFRRHLGRALEVQFVAGGFEIPKSGKHRFVINKVSQGQGAPAAV